MRPGQGAQSSGVEAIDHDIAGRHWSNGSVPGRSVQLYLKLQCIDRGKITAQYRWLQDGVVVHVASAQ